MATIDDARRELVRSRAFIRGAETQLSKALDALDAAMGAAPEPPADPEPPVPEPSGDLVQYPSPEVEFIVGPQLVHGSEANPWPWFDRNQTEHSDKLWNDGSWSDLANGYYYDHALTQYIAYYRTGDEKFRERATTAARTWWEGMPDLVGWEPYRNPFSVAPRNAALAGLILYALEGGGSEPLMFERGAAPHEQVPMTLWDWLTTYTRDQYQMWLGRRLANGTLHYGVRDGGYALLYAAQLAAVHPDAAVRAEMREMAIRAAVDYYARLQYDDGGWYWSDDGSEVHPGGVWSQPFMVGLLLEGMIAVHHLTDDTTVAASITAAVDHIWRGYWLDDEVPERPGVMWRGVPYFMFTDGTASAPPTGIAGGWDTNTIRDQRQRNSLVVHAFGYAYRLTGDPKYREQGDEIFAATYGKGEGPLADAFYGLADFRGKEFNQAYRSAGRFLAWRGD